MKTASFEAVVLCFTDHPQFVDRAPSKFITAVVERVVGMAFDLMEGDLVFPRESEEFLPKIVVEEIGRAHV